MLCWSVYIISLYDKKYCIRIGCTGAPDDARGPGDGHMSPCFSCYLTPPLGVISHKQGHGKCRFNQLRGAQGTNIVGGGGGRGYICILRK